MVLEVELKEREKGIIGEEVVPDGQRGESTLGIGEETLSESREPFHSESIVADIQVLESGVGGECLLQTAGSIYV